MGYRETAVVAGIVAIWLVGFVIPGTAVVWRARLYMAQDLLESLLFGTLLALAGFLALILVGYTLGLSWSVLALLHAIQSVAALYWGRGFFSSVRTSFRSEPYSVITAALAVALAVFSWRMGASLLGDHTYHLAAARKLISSETMVTSAPFFRDNFEIPYNYAFNLVHSLVAYFSFLLDADVTAVYDNFSIILTPTAILSWYCLGRAVFMRESGGLMVVAAHLVYSYFQKWHDYRHFPTPDQFTRNMLLNAVFAVFFISLRASGQIRSIIGLAIGIVTILYSHMYGILAFYATMSMFLLMALLFSQRTYLRLGFRILLTSGVIAIPFLAHRILSTNFGFSAMGAPSLKFDDFLNNWTMPPMQSMTIGVFLLLSACAWLIGKMRGAASNRSEYSLAVPIMFGCAIAAANACAAVPEISEILARIFSNTYARRFAYYGYMPSILSSIAVYSMITMVSARIPIFAVKAGKFVIAAAAIAAVCTSFSIPSNRDLNGESGYQRTSGTVIDYLRRNLPRTWGTLCTYGAAGALIASQTDNFVTHVPLSQFPPVSDKVTNFPVLRRLLLFNNGLSAFVADFRTLGCSGIVIDRTESLYPELGVPTSLLREKMAMLPAIFIHRFSDAKFEFFQIDEGAAAALERELVTSRANSGVVDVPPGIMTRVLVDPSIENLQLAESIRLSTRPLNRAFDHLRGRVNGKDDYPPVFPYDLNLLLDRSAGKDLLNFPMRLPNRQVQSYILEIDLLVPRTLQKVNMVLDGHLPVVIHLSFKLKGALVKEGDVNSQSWPFVATDPLVADQIKMTFSLPRQGGYRIAELSIF